MQLVATVTFIQHESDTVTYHKLASTCHVSLSVGVVEHHWIAIFTDLCTMIEISMRVNVFKIYQYSIGFFFKLLNYMSVLK